jgi:hypothetical protein
VFIDGRILEGASIGLAAGKHELAAVAPGYYGEIRRVALEERRAAEPVGFTLEATRLPGLEEEQRFLKLADAPSLDEAKAGSVGERTLATVLRAKRLLQTGDSAAFAELSRDVETLRRLGDARAAVASLLIDSVRSGNISRSQVTQSLIAASDGGDAMASLFLAVAYRESINASGALTTPADPRFRGYCEHMSRAAAQGWVEVASEYSRRDHCPN